MYQEYWHTNKNLKAFPKINLSEYLWTLTLHGICTDLHVLKVTFTVQLAYILSIVFIDWLHQYHVYICRLFYNNCFKVCSKYVYLNALRHRPLCKKIGALQESHDFSAARNRSDNGSLTGLSSQHQKTSSAL